jgi:hypothetical protein
MKKSVALTGSVVYVDQEYIAQAMQYLATSGRTQVAFTHVDGMCVGIDTQAPDRIFDMGKIMRAFQAPSVTVTDGVGPMMLGQDTEALTNENILLLIQDSGSITARKIGDHFGLPSSGKQRHALTEMMKKLVKAGTIVKRAKGTGTTYHPASSRPGRKARETARDTAPADHTEAVQPAAKDNGKPTYEAVAAEMERMGEGLSMAIGDALGYERTDTKNRAHITKHLNKMAADNVVHVTGSAHGIMKLWKFGPAP